MIEIDEQTKTFTLEKYIRRAVEYVKHRGRGNEIKVNCPFCGGTEFAEGYQSGYGALTGTESIFASSTLYHIICRNCGSVVHSYVKNPEKILKWSNRR